MHATTRHRTARLTTSAPFVCVPTHCRGPARIAAVAELLESRRLLSATTFTIDPARSFIDVDAEFASSFIEFAEQAPGSLRTSYFGTIAADVGDGTIAFNGGSSATANDSGNWSPGRDPNDSMPNPPAEPANYGGRSIGLFTNGNIAIRDGVLDVVSPAIPVATGGAFDSTLITFSALSGVAEYYDPQALMWGSEDLTDEFVTDFNAPPSSYVVQNGVATLTLQIDAYLDRSIFSFDGPPDTRIFFDGQIVATAPVVAPLPAWVAPGSAATWDPSTKALTVTGAASIIADPGADSPLITAHGSAAALTINPASGRAVHVGGLTLAGGATATVTSVTSGATPTATAVSLDSSTRKAARGTAVRPGARPKPQLTSLVAAAALRTAANSRVLVVNGDTFNIDVNSKLDLVDNNLILNYSGVSPAAGVEGMVKAGYNSGDWLGNRISSSAANANRNFALGVSDNSSLVIPFSNTRPFAGESVDATAVLVKFTHRVDLDLDGVITTNDATIFNSNYSEGGTARWGIGDVDFDGLFTSNDATLFNSFYDETLGAV